LASTSITIRTDTEIKQQAAAILADLGMDMSTGVNVFLRAVVREGGLPFAIALETPAEYREWMRQELAKSWDLAQNPDTKRISDQEFWRKFES